MVGRGVAAAGLTRASTFTAATSTHRCLQAARNLIDLATGASLGALARRVCSLLHMHAGVVALHSLPVLQAAAMPAS